MRLAALLAALAAPAHALTCAPPDPLRSFQEAQAAPEAYVVLNGRLDVDRGLMPPGDGSVRDPGPVPAAFDGVALGLEGFAQPLRAEVTVQPVCAGPWCGSIGPGTYLLFAQDTGAGYEVTVGPCGGRAFGDPEAAVLDALVACLRGEGCG